MLVGFKRKICTLLAAVCVLHTLSLRAFALDSTFDNLVDDGQTALLKVGTNLQAESDFVTEFPNIVMEEVKTNIRPSADLQFQERKDYVTIPLYYQNDYPETLYGENGGTVATSGCSITSAAMVATYLTGYEYLPDELAYYFGGRSENNIERMETAMKTLLHLEKDEDLEKPENIDKTIEELKKGKCAIVLMGNKSKFTNSQHFIVLTGIKDVTPEPAATESGEPAEPIPESQREYRIFVNDSYAPNYNNPDLKNGFENGFHPDFFRNEGYQGAWVFDKTQVPKDLKRYFEVQPEPAESRYPDINLTFAERQLLAKVIWVEARGESPEGQQAVAEVVLNRMLSKNFPEKLRDVIYEDGQFRSVKFLDDAKPGQSQYRAIENALYGPNILPMDVVYFATFKTNDNYWGTIGGHKFCFEEDKDMSKAVLQSDMTESGEISNS